MRGTCLRRIAAVLTFSVGLVTVGLAGAGLATDPSAARSAATLVPAPIGLQAAALAAEPERPADRITKGRSTTQRWAVGLAFLVPLATVAFALACWPARSSLQTSRSQAPVLRAPQRAPPSSSLARP